jgi:hypothetical protein
MAQYGHFPVLIKPVFSHELFDPGLNEEIDFHEEVGTDLDQLGTALGQLKPKVIGVR